jgi:hypothetical protein
MGRLSVNGNKEGVGGTRYCTVANLNEWERNRGDKRKRDKCTKVVRERRSDSEGSVLMQGREGKERGIT